MLSMLKSTFNISDSMAISKILIDKEAQFSHLRQKYSHYAGCASHIDLRQVKNHLIVILTTQRTGSTLLCQDIESSCRLSYSPTESFIPLLQGFSKCTIEPDEISNRIENILQSFADQDLSVFKIMVDYIGWLGFFCADKDRALNWSYAQLSAFFIDKLKCIDPSKQCRFVRLDRKDKLKQAVSRLINSMGLPTHIKTEADANHFEIQLSNKLAKYPNYHCMIIDQLGIILRQLCILDDCLSRLANTELYCCYEFEDDLLERKDIYLNNLLEGIDCQPSSIRRALKPTAGKRSREMLRNLLQIIGYIE